MPLCSASSLGLNPHPAVAQCLRKQERNIAVTLVRGRPEKTAQVDLDADTASTRAALLVRLKKNAKPCR